MGGLVKRAMRRRAPWAVISALGVGVSASLGFIANLGGTRDVLCEIDAVANLCRDWGLTRVEALHDDPQQTRARLLSAAEGSWGRQDSDCSDIVRYTVAHGEDGVYRITATALNFSSVSQVIAADNGVIVVRDAQPSATGAREQWEFRPDGDRLTIYDKDGVATTLVRCGASGG